MVGKRGRDVSHWGWLLRAGVITAVGLAGCGRTTLSLAEERQLDSDGEAGAPGAAIDRDEGVEEADSPITPADEDLAPPDVPPPDPELTSPQQAVEQYPDPAAWEVPLPDGYDTEVTPSVIDVLVENADELVDYWLDLMDQVVNEAIDQTTVPANDTTCDLTVVPSDLEVGVEWAFAGQGEEISALASPVVADLTGDGIPDVVVTLYRPLDWFGLGHLYVLDGATGALHYRIDEPVAAAAHPAVGDIDGDGAPEIVTFGPDSPVDGRYDCTGRLLAFEADGSPKWQGDTEFFGCQYAVGLADFEGDGDVEIYAGGLLADHEGRELFNVERGTYAIQVSTAADLDEDGVQELIIGPLALRVDGSIYYDHSADLLVDTDDDGVGDTLIMGPSGPPVTEWEMAYGHPQVADLDGDGHPEVLVMSPAGPRLVQHDGTLEPIVSPGCEWGWMPAALGDLDGDGRTDVAGATHASVCVTGSDLSLHWEHCSRDDGYAAVSAFDLFGDGGAEILYADNQYFYIFGEGGELFYLTERRSVTQVEFPLVVDADADGSAEILLISNDGYQEQLQPAVRLLGSAGRDWAGTRQIWNQHSFHGTNVLDDATIPSPEPPHWHHDNSFRMQHPR